MGSNRNELIQIIILVILYVLLGNSRSVQPNPFLTGAVIAVNMIVPVLGGILFGWRVGLLTGLAGTILNSLSPAANPFESLAVIPHGLMGLSAGLISRKFPSPIAAGALIIGHTLNMIMFISFGLIEITILHDLTFWLGITYEAFIGMVSIVIISAIYRMGFNAANN